MRFTKEKIFKEITAALEEISGKKDVQIDNTSNPIEVLALDSGHGIPFACELEVRLSISIPEEMNPLVIDGPRQRARTVGEIVDLMISLCQEQKEGQ